MSPLESMRAVLQEQLDAHQQQPTNFYAYAERFRGVAGFAREVAGRHSDDALIALADQILVWLDERQSALEEESQLEQDRLWERDQARHDVRKRASKAVKNFIGMEVADERFCTLVEAYQRAFPSFLVRQSVYNRLHPKKYSASIRSHLYTLIEEQKLGREPTFFELQAAHPHAVLAHEQEVLKYLERALPGFDFAAIWISTA